jgi:hypothetical protein
MDLYFYSSVFGLWEAMVNIMIGGIDLHSMSFVLEGMCKIDDELLGTTDSKVWVNKGDS